MRLPKPLLDICERLPAEGAFILESEQIAVNTHDSLEFFGVILTSRKVIPEYGGAPRYHWKQRAAQSSVGSFTRPGTQSIPA
jgi:hypothetical protein